MEDQDPPTAPPLAPPQPPKAPGPPPPSGRTATKPASPPTGGGGNVFAEMLAKTKKSEERSAEELRKAATVGEVKEDELVGRVTNDSYQWLTYETLFNQRPFRKSNQERRMGLYLMLLKDVRVFVCQHIPDPILQQLADAFFPDLPMDQLKARSALDSLWQPSGSAKPPSDMATPPELPASRAVVLVHLGQSVVMPYNFSDNANHSRAIGTNPLTHCGAKLRQLTKSWAMWKTASRSSVVHLERVKKVDAPWTTQAGSDPSSEALVKPDGYEWAFGEGDQRTDHFSESRKSKAFSVSELPGCFSVKTGVCYVGSTEQAGDKAGGKDILEINSVDACLRSDYVALVDKELGLEPKNDPDLLLLKELLSITEFNPKKPVSLGDGVQVRDLSCLDSTKIYFPPISIPFVDLEFKTLQRRFAGASIPAWVEFWKNHYAARLGHTKALVLLRYGLQWGSPNAQNFLLELNKDLKPTGRVVFRDIGDAQLHREVAWALYGPPNEPPPTGGVEAWTQLAKLTLAPLKYECNDLRRIKDYIMETGVVDPEGAYGKVPGTQMRWNLFSALSKGSLVATGGGKASTDHGVRAEGWQQVLDANCTWGLAHARAFVECVEKCLGIKCTVSWDTYPSPRRYGQMRNDNYAGAGAAYDEDLRWEEEASAVVHRVLASTDGQRAIKEYKGRKWKPK